MRLLKNLLQSHGQLIFIGILTGLLTATSFIPFYPWAILFNYVPLWWYWLQKAPSGKHVLWSGWLSQFVTNLIGFHWVYHVSFEFGHIPKPLSILVLILFSSLAHLYFPLVGYFVFRIKQKLENQTSPKIPSSPLATNIPASTPSFTFFLLLLTISLWSLCEIYWPYIFQWHMGYTLLWAKLPLFHWADVIGFQALSFILLCFNAFIVFSLIHSKKSPTSLFTKSTTLMVKPALIALSLFALLNGLGWLHGKSWKTKKYDSKISFLPIQANIGNAEKIMAERGLGFQDFIAQKFIELSKKAIQKYPDANVLIWPESAIPDLLDQEFSHQHRPQWIRQFLKENKKFLITGGYSREYKANHLKQIEEKTYNALFTFNSEGLLASPPYRKTHLLVFGEYTPLSDWIPFLKEISPAGSGFNKGTGPKTLSIKGLQTEPFYFAPQLCYESLYPDDSRYTVLNKAQMLINITNDSWFGPDAEPFQHLSMTFARAIENRRPLIRVTNTGITSGIEASGQTLIQSPLYQEWAEPIVINYDQNPPLTFYTQYGGLWPFLVILIFIGGLIGVIYCKTKNSTQ